MKLLGIDYGSKRVGIAVSDQDATIAFPRMALPNDEKLASLLVALIQEEKIGRIIVGDTRTSGGRENPVTSAAEKFAAMLSTASSVPVEFAPEIWSSIEASRYAEKGNEHNDAAAAAIILQRFLDMNATG
jgi:putative Holliday junction resolvase